MLRVLPKLLPSEEATFLVSGGVDSIAAAHWMIHRFRRPCTILHFNHNVQAANDEMEHKVHSFAEACGVPFVCITRNKEDFQDESECGLRNWRLEILKNSGGHFITAHHLNDAVENYLDNTLKGSPEHIPIQPVSSFGTFTIYHPFLVSTKRSLQKYAENHDLLKFIESDPTNEDLSLKRNWIRHKLAQEIYDRDLGIEKVVWKKFYKEL